MWIYKNLAGKTFNNWTILEFSHQHPKSRNAYWKARCICGKESIICGSSAEYGRNKQCKSCASRKRGRRGNYAQAYGDLYFIRVGDYVKIGVSQNVARRVRDINSINPYDVKLIYHGIGEANYEEYWHKKYAYCHHRGEWFYIPEIINTGKRNQKGEINMGWDRDREWDRGWGPPRYPWRRPWGLGDMIGAAVGSAIGSALRPAPPPIIIHEHDDDERAPDSDEPVVVGEPPQHTPDPKAADTANTK